MSSLFRTFGALAAGSMVLIAVACSGAGEPAGPDRSTPAAAPAQTEAVASTPATPPELTTQAELATQPIPTPATATDTPEPALTPDRLEPTPTATQTPAPMTDYDSAENMYRLFSGRDHDPDDTREAIRLAVANKDRSMVPLMIEMVRFYGDQNLIVDTGTALSAITGRGFGPVLGSWKEWMEWLGKNADEHRPPDGYVQWKSTLMSLVDPRFADFLAPAEQGSRINVAEIAWGGVRPDGIPDLQNAPVVSAGDQDYLRPDDRVFGVSINGEHRAYPLRIVNAHEMANDVLGGEPIALAY